LDLEVISPGLKALLERIGLLRPTFALFSRLRAVRLAASPSAVPLEFDDGLPLPPASLLIGIGGATTPAAYLHGGVVVATAVRTLLADHGVSVAEAGALLDFGCGCGRVLRRFRDLAPTVQLHGTDYERGPIEWCRQHLPFANFEVNQLAPPLGYPDARFGIAYSFSVFTHLPHELQVAWSAELRRVLKPGGHAVITVHADRESGALGADERRRFDAGELVVRYGSVAGSNLCAVFHPVAYIERTLGQGWDLVEIRPSDTGQTMVLLRKP
jgi:SAM-dependent methyltransferase